MPTIMTSPMKCKTIMNAHHHLLNVTARLNLSGVGSKVCKMDPTVPSVTVASGIAIVWPAELPDGGCRLPCSLFLP